MWPGGEHAFRLRIGELRALDDICIGGVFAAHARLSGLQPRLDDVLETVRLGLIGGGMAQDQARALVKRVEEEVGFGYLIPLAVKVLGAGFYRREAVEAPAGEDPAAAGISASDSDSSTA